MSVSDVTAFREPIVKATAIREHTAERASAVTTADSAVEPVGPAPEWSLARQMTLANAITTASLLVGLIALFEAARAPTSMPAATLRLIVGLICTAALLDAVDGPLARLQRTAGPFGSNLDSLADMVSFGAAPAVALFVAQLHTVPVAGLVASAAFCTCAAWRLARFPLCKSSAAFVGCPVPLAAVIASLVALTASSPVVTLVTVGALSWMMVGTTPFPTWTRVLGGSRPARER